MLKSQNFRAFQMAVRKTRNSMIFVSTPPCCMHLYICFKLSSLNYHSLCRALQYVLCLLCFYDIAKQKIDGGNKQMNETESNHSFLRYFYLKIVYKRLCYYAGKEFSILSKNNSTLLNDLCYSCRFETISDFFLFTLHMCAQLDKPLCLLWFNNGRVQWHATVIQLFWRPNFGTVWIQYQLGITVL